MDEDSVVLADGVQLLPDQPISEHYNKEDDGLGFDTYARVLARAVLGTRGPFTIGIFGGWGTGKTSLLRMTKGLLDSQKEKGVVTVWFNAWRFEQDQHPIIPLVATIIRALDPHKPHLAKLKDRLGELLYALAAVVQGFTVKVKQPDVGGYEVEAGLSVKDAMKAWEEVKQDPQLDQSLYLGAFDRLSSIDVGDELKIVVLIDDLDRCLPDRAIKLLEAIKLILSQPGFIFVLGVSRDVLEGYLEHRYAQEYGIEGFRGRRYLDKIVQLPFEIPPHSGRMEAFSESVLNRLQPSDARVLKDILPIIGVACGNNPRATIRFVNNLLVDKAINRALAPMGEMSEIPIGYFAVTRALQQRWSGIWDLLRTSDQLCLEMATWEKDDLAQYVDSDDKDESEVARQLGGNGDLRDLVLSDAGREWLKNDALRVAAEEYLEVYRRHTAEGADEAQKFQLVLLLYSPENAEEMRQIRAVLEHHVPGVISAKTDLLPAIGEDVVVVCIVGSESEQWKRDTDVWSFLSRCAGPSLSFVVLPEAAGSQVPLQFAHKVTVPLPQGEICRGDLMPLLEALSRYPWTRERRVIGGIQEKVVGTMVSTVAAKR